MQNEPETTLKDVTDRLDRLQGTLDRILSWTRFDNLPKLGDIISKELDDDKKKSAFELSDGTRGYRDVGKDAGIPAPTVQTWWKRWYNVGILTPSENRKGRLERICSLRELGIEIPKGIRNKVVEKVVPQEAEGAENG